MDNSNDWTVRILKNDSESLLRAKDEEYDYWQGQSPLERLAAMQQLSLALFEECCDEAEIRQQFLRSPVCIRRPCSSNPKSGADEVKELRSRGN